MKHFPVDAPQYAFVLHQELEEIKVRLGAPEEAPQWAADLSEQLYRIEATHARIEDIFKQLSEQVGPIVASLASNPLFKTFLGV
jgi:hypothetical protein